MSTEAEAWMMNLDETGFQRLSWFNEISHADYRGNRYDTNVVTDWAWTTDCKAIVASLVHADSTTADRDAAEIVKIPIPYKRR